MQTVAAERITELRRRIADANRRYHEEDAPDITDAQYDALVRELEALEREHPESVDADSPTRKVGSAPSGRFAPVQHAVPMLSLAKAYTDQDVVDFIERARRFFERDKDLELAFTAEPKIDGFRPRCAMRTACSFRARHAVTVPSARTSRPI